MSPASNTALITATASAPAANTWGAFCRVMPPIATSGKSNPPARLGENRQRRAHRAGLGHGTEHAAESQVIHARLRRRLGQFNAVVAGSTEQFSWSQSPPRLDQVAIVCAQVCAVGADLQRKFDIVIDDESYAGRAA